MITKQNCRRRPIGDDCMCTHEIVAISMNRISLRQTFGKHTLGTITKVVGVFRSAGGAEGPGESFIPGRVSPGEPTRLLTRKHKTSAGRRPQHAYPIDSHV